MEEITKNTSGTMPESSKPRKSSKKKFFLWGFVVFFLIAGVTGIGIAQKVKQMRDGGPLMYMMNKITKDLNLTAQQKADVDKLKDEIKAKRESMKKDRSGGMDDFANAFKQDKLDKETLKSIEQKHEADRQEMKDFMMDELVKFHDILTPDQRNQVVEKMKEMKDKRKDMFNKKHGNKDDGTPPENH